MTSGAQAWLIDQRWAKAYPLAEITSIGRGAESTIVLRDPAVSRRHAEITREGDAYVLRAMGSAGTTLNGVRVATDCVLQENDLIEIAFTILRFTQLAPTGEMFVVPRDSVYSRDRINVPTRATLHRLHPITLISRWQRYWHLLLGLLLVILALAICAPAGTG
jgi:pSer/pThr/pTyr-binding forkhead associated (FHA) protein